jgi:hypothetical protein
MKIQVTGLIFLLAVTAANGQEGLFDSTESLALTIEAPMRELIRKRLDKPELDATVTYTTASGESRSIPATVSSRGNARLLSCNFPPIRVEFKPEAVQGTPFEGERRLKMVTPCARGKKEQGWLAQEYGIYTAFNFVTDYSYRVRRLEVSFRDIGSSRWERQLPAFFIEATGELAERVGMASLRPPEIAAAQFDGESLTNNVLFQFLIANTDFSIKRGPRGEGCCHNGRVVAPAGQQGDYVIVPYDFDQAGVINADYALPDERLRIRYVTSRLYRGFCWQNDMLPAAISRFNDHREVITSALAPDGISNNRRKRAIRFVDRFYDIINDPEELEKHVVAKCRGAATFSVRKTRTAR